MIAEGFYNLGGSETNRGEPVATSRAFQLMGQVKEAFSVALLEVIQDFLDAVGHFLDE